MTIKKRIIVFCLFNILGISSVNCGIWNLLNFEKIEQKTVSFSSQIQKEIEILKKNVSEHEQFLTQRKEDIEQYNRLLSTLKAQLNNASQDEKEFINKHIAIISQILQVLNEIIQSHNQIIAYQKEQIELLSDYKQDPEFKNKNFFVEQKSIYSLNDLQRVSQLLLNFDSEVKKLEEQSKKVALDIENRKKTQQLTQEEFEKIKKEQREFKSQEGQAEAESGTLTVKQQGALIDAQERLLFFRKILADLRLKEIVEKAQLIDTSLRINKLQAAEIKKEYDRIKSELNIDKKDIEKAEESLKRQQQELATIQREYEEKINALEYLKNNEQNELKQYRQNYDLNETEFNAAVNWVIQPKSIRQWNQLINIGRLANRLKYEINVNKDLLQAKIDGEKFKADQEEVDLLLIKTWSKLSNREFDRTTQEVLQKEIKQYEKIKADLQSQISSTSDKKSQAAQALSENANITENIKARIRDLKGQRDTIFSNENNKYSKLLNTLKAEATEEAPKRGEVIAQLIETYTNISNARRTLVKKIDSIIEELKSKHWIGVPPLWQGIRHFVPDVKRFFKFIGEQKISVSFANFQESISNIAKYYAQNPMAIFSLILQLIIVILVFVLLKLYLPDLRTIFQTTTYYGVGQTFGVLLSILLSFLNKYLVPFFLWTLLFLGIKFGVIEDTFTSILFYFFSMIFWLYYASKFFKYIKQANKEREYIFVAKLYQKRFFGFAQVLVYASIVILFFRQAFIEAPFVKSEVPTVLLAINFMLLQICVIGIISRRQILNLIPQTTAFWQSIYDIIERFYYLFLAMILFIIIMSNPYIGYGPQFFYFVSRLILILLLLPIFSLLHSQFKRLAEIFFFSRDEEGVTKERFSYGRTAYGVLVIFSFLLFALVGLVLAANLLGYTIGFSEVLSIIRTDLYYFEDPYTLKQRAVDFVSLVWAAIYILGGILVAYLINRFILERIFDLLLVNIGVQNAVLTFSRYFIILISIIVALKSIGQSSLLAYILFVITALGFAIKEMISDFLSYFVILVQRPVKIGDFIKIDENVIGIVRHITLRSIILRRKNSTTIIVPNSQIMTNAIVNWNYSRTFFAFEDIRLTVSYSADPAQVKQLILKVLENNMNILKNPAPIVRLNDFTENGFLYIVRGFLSPDKVIDQFDIASDVRLELVRVLRENGIKIASPTRILVTPDKESCYDLISQDKQKNKS